MTLNDTQLNKMCTAYQEKVFEVLLDVLVLNSEHGCGQLVDGCG